MNGFFWNLFSFMVAIALLVTFHEWGHFLIARLFKVDVLRFSVGFGKIIARWQGRKGTEYALSILPLGGYVKMLDEREGPVPAERLPYAFNQQNVFKRFAIVLAGPVFNFIFAFVAYWLMFVVGVQQSVPFIDDVKTNSIAAEAGILAGDEITAIENEAVGSWTQVIEKIILHGQTNEKLQLTVKQQGGGSNTVSLYLKDWTLNADDGNPILKLGITPFRPKVKPIIQAVSIGEPAADAGLRQDDEILTVGDADMSSWHDFVLLIRESANKTVPITILRNGLEKDIELIPREKIDDGKTIGYVGIQPKVINWPEDKIRTQQLGFTAAIPQALEKTWEMSKLTGVLLSKLFTGFISPNTISGPIGIAQGAGASASGGISHYLNFLALVSISLAILNLLPIPVLDGGHLFYYLIEMIKGKPVSEKTQEWGFKLGILFILLLMMLAFYNDLSRLFLK